MQIIKYDPIQTTTTEKISALPSAEMANDVRQIIADVRLNGDLALRNYTAQFDGVRLDSFAITKSQCQEALACLSGKTREALELMATNLRLFATSQLAQVQDFEYQVVPGVFCGQRVLPLQRVGIYTPGGNFPLVSSLLMGAIPASVAGVGEIVVCTPPAPDGSLHPAMLAAAAIAGVDELYTLGGPQAIAALAYGTATLRPVDKIVGPGNCYVTAAKKEVYGQVGIDFLAGPSEIMIIADPYANPIWVAADLLAQAEHDRMAIPLLITTSSSLAQQVVAEIDKQLKELDTADIATQSIAANGRIYLVDSLDQAVLLANQTAPEHLELHLQHPEAIIGKLKNYGTLFIGSLAGEVLGDYSSGLNHTLPTAGAARYTGGLSVRDFVKISTTLRTTPQGLAEIGPTANTLARLEGLSGHANAVNIRLKD